MPAAVTPPPQVALTPRTLARLTGALLLCTIVAGIVAQVFISDRLVIPGDATGTAQRMLAREPVFRLGFTIYMVEMAAQMAMTLLFYFLLKPVDRIASLLAAVFGLVGCTIKTLSRVFYLAPLLVLAGNSPLAHAFEASQRHALALFFLGVNDQAAGMALGFFGLSGILRGWLMLRSTFLPRVLGAVTLVGGVGWLTFMSPALGLRLFPIVAGVGILGALLTVGWLLIVGVHEGRWQAEAGRASLSVWR